MRRLSTTLAIVIALLLTLSIAISAGGCGTSAQTAGLSDSDLSPESILAKAVAASQEMNSAKGSFDVQISFDADLSQLSEEERALLAQPMGLSGTLAYGSEPPVGEVTIGISALGETMDIGVKLLGDKAWIRFMGQWYEAPPEMEEMLADPAASSVKMADVNQLLGDLGIEPVTWLSDLRLVGEEVLDGTEAYHLAAVPDLAKMLTDVIELVQSGELMKLVDPTGSADELMGSFAPAPGTDELRDMQKQLEAMFQDLTADLWVAKDGFAILKFSATALMTPPAGEDPAGVDAVRLSATVSLQDVNRPVSVEPPASAQPWKALEKAMEENPGMFMGPFFGSALGGASAASGTY